MLDRCMQNLPIPDLINLLEINSTLRRMAMTMIQRQIHARLSAWVGNSVLFLRILAVSYPQT